MKLSRPCYDKPRRCPGWAGGGNKYAKVKRCDNGYVTWPHGNRWWFGHCDTCGLTVLPFSVRWTSWRTWAWTIKYKSWHLADWWRYDRDHPRRWRRLWLALFH